MYAKFYHSCVSLVLALSLAFLPTGTGSAAKAARKCLQPPAGLSAWWPGDGNADDIAGGRGAEFHGDAATGAGLVGQAFILDGDGDFVSVPHVGALDLGTGDFTIDLWVYFNDTAGEQVLIEKWIQRFPGSVGWTLTKLEDNVLRLAMANGDGSETNVDSGVLSIPTDAWTHFAATRKGKHITLYMNGVPVAKGKFRLPLNLDSDASIKFGHRGSPSDTPGSEDERGAFLNGRVDEVDLFVGEALSRGRIKAIFKAGSAGKCKNPQMDLRVNYGHDWVESFYEAGHKVRLVVTESDGVTVKAAAKVITEPKDFWGGEPGFTTSPEDWKPAPPDIQPYDRVFAWVDNGVRAQVQLGEINGRIDLAADSIQGTIAAPWFEDEVLVECHPWGSPDPVELKLDTVLPDGTDPYSCSWAGEWDIQPYQDVGASYYGPDGHWVANAFFARNPYIVVSIAGDWFWTAEFNPGLLNLSIYDSDAGDAALLWQGSREANESGFIHVFFEDHGLDLVPGYVVVVSDGATEKRVLLEMITMEVFDPENEIMAGTAPPGREVVVVAGMAEAETQGVLFVIADPQTGAWFADFTSIGFDITEEMRGPSFAQIHDEDGDANEAGTPPAP